MKRFLKIVGLLLLGIVAAALIVLRITGLDPQDPPRDQLAEQHEIAHPGLWLRGELVTTPVTDWAAVRSAASEQGATTLMIETRTPYFIPHSVRAAGIVRNGQLYVPSRQGCPNGLHGEQCAPYNGPNGVNPIEASFPKNKFWTANVMRDPRVRIKIGDKLYEATMVLMTDRAEVEAALGRNPQTTEKGPDGQEHTIGYTHFFHVFQRNITEHGKSTLPEAPRKD